MKKKNTQPPASVPPVVGEAVAHLLKGAVLTVHMRQARLLMAEAAMGHGNGILQGCHDESGNPLDEASCLAIERYLSQPSAAGWSEIECVSIAGGVTLGEWWTMMVRRRSPGAVVPAPSANHLRLAIEVALAENLAAAQAGVAELAP
ncbi:hypothetical protein [Paraburkholderia youngii]|uniref:hypothetical protein n=1 Tax=Paraburkholderia youngii TaxID=2782701 RepID=UPI003D23263C